MLHIVNKSATERNSLESCLRLATKGSAVLLIEDAVYAATKGGVAAAKVQSAMADVQIYALGPDLEARGMAARVLDGVKVVDYGGFVDLVSEHNNCQSWL
ncbi:MAG TPA: sulfurtransferase complex subunit TusB [Thiobacillaceae bacterium]|nr:sulfurtransferase complex subunit TusB [Nitrospira sp.]HNA31167.1 sulfurtransferase complex subunit TusB [Thiobacillaceae bacterium]HNA83047.1 sulfurtransferase complex subunit TusB [Thiobacillaceae bacterium]HNF89899.1 sulfurtransferase complex subunit TusB [Thiobacillaceae bacterium]HNH87819.1 sulfurtransferase complex subunit TusB [Thiobacillaceae bacterium]